MARVLIYAYMYYVFFSHVLQQLGMVGEWRHGLCNCFDDIGICIIAYFVPCVTFGQNAEAIGEGSCLLCGTYNIGLNCRF